ncbi:hypothetical protein HYG81_21370 (plasmid) [Natrinema zhouii]|uniref:hypothetical protein n=1 Tax=Natrinema zhouii TaxID=1710539 RepID=UPI001CFF57EA|nr:hypothetical protein [Natrinema zhouii]UHQ98131.1 hypothetical protein HYG81_21370 [Natrinema zhouii]
MKELATEIHNVLDRIVGPDLKALGYYTPDDYGAIYLCDEMRDEYTEDEVEAILKNALLETISQPAHEDLHDERLYVTIRVFEKKADITITTGENSGVIFALDPEGEYSYQEIIDTVYETVDLD